MNINIQHRLGRRTFLQASIGGAAAVAADRGFAAETAARPAKAAKRCIVLWMDGGPSHVDTFDSKPDAGSSIRGVLDSIDTAIPGVSFSEKFPELARRADRLCVLRGMNTEEADHGRARIYMHTGYKPGQGGLSYPVFGSVVAAELGRSESPLPNFVVTGSTLNKYDYVTDPGFRGPRHAALVHDYVEKPLENLSSPATSDAFALRTATLAKRNADFAARYAANPVDAQRAVFDQAVRLMKAEAAQAFDLSQEPAKAAEPYGDHPFGRGCLLARRLMEVDVPFVEVYLGSFDTHEKPVADAALELMPAVDRGFAALLEDLATRGLLDDTLVVWMGEFGRTPTVNRNGGRDHYAKAWTTVLAGGPIRGGRAIGRTDANGAAVVERPINVREFQATLCRAMGIDHKKKVMTPIGREVTIVDTGGEPIAEAFA